MTAIEIIEKHIAKNKRMTKEFTGNKIATEIGMNVIAILEQILKEIKEQENEFRKVY